MDELKMHKCIYCLQEKTSTHFKKSEHVLPKSFGKFKDNFTLRNKVCDECNQYFGDTIEIRLARGTYEGIKRYIHGIKKYSEFKGILNQSLLRIYLNENLYKGLILALKYSPCFDEIIVQPVPQIGFKKNDETYDYFDLAEKLPTKEKLEQHYVLQKNDSIHIVPDTAQQIAKTYLAEIGIKLKTTKLGPINLRTTSPDIMVKITSTIDNKIRRAVAKIAFNYFAYFNESSLLLTSQFNTIRNIILNGDEPSWPIIKIDTNPILENEKDTSIGRLGHIITLHDDINGSIIAQVSLFNLLRYSVILAKNFSGEKPKIGFGHFFDFTNKRIIDIQKSLLIIPKIKLILPY